MTELNQIDLRALAAGSKRTWDTFVVAATPLINAVVRRALTTYRLSEDDVMAELARIRQEEFARRFPNLADGGE